MKISEKMLEDFFYEYPEELYSNIEILGRQVTLPHGIVDLLGWDCLLNRVMVIELKACPIKNRDIAQVLRYCHDIGIILRRAGNSLLNEAEISGDLSDFGPTRKEIFLKNWRTRLEDINEDGYFYRFGDSIKPVLVGTSVDYHTLIAAKQANIWLVLWEHNPKDNTISTYFAPSIKSIDVDAPPTWATEIVNLIFDACFEETEQEYQTDLNYLFELEPD